MVPLKLTVTKGPGGGGRAHWSVDTIFLYIGETTPGLDVQSMVCQKSIWDWAHSGLRLGTVLALVLRNHPLHHLTQGKRHYKVQHKSE